VEYVESTWNLWGRVKYTNGCGIKRDRTRAREIKKARGNSSSLGDLRSSSTRYAAFPYISANG
jgi:hypothetical protein